MYVSIYNSMVIQTKYYKMHQYNNIFKMILEIMKAKNIMQKILCNLYIRIYIDKKMEFL